MIKHTANILTSFRILGSCLLLLFPVFSVAFYIIYIFCGLSDMADGTIARKTNSTSILGSQLDSIADLVFVVVSMIRLLPAIHLPKWVLIWCGMIALIKTGNILWAYACKKQVVFPHTIMNKATGLLLFLLPLTISFVDVKYSSILVCCFATLSAIQEGLYMISDRNNE